MKYIADTLSKLDDMRKALAVAEGLPRRAADVHPAIARLVPATYAPGAFGWTDNLVPVATDLKDGTGVLEIHPEAERYAGYLVTVSAKQVAIATPVTMDQLSKTVADKLAAVSAAADPVAVDVAVQTKGG